MTWRRGLLLCRLFAEAHADEHLMRIGPFEA